MNSSRIDSFSKGCALLLLAACAGCSSSSGGSGASSGASTGASSGASTGASSGSSGSGSASTGGGSGASSGTGVGTGMLCPTVSTLTVATMVSVEVSWPMTTSVLAGTAQPYLFWFLSTYTVDSSNKITGTVRACNNVIPTILLTSTGDMGVGVPSGQTGKVEISSPPSEFDKISRITAVTGALGSWNVGSSITIDPSVSLLGLSDSSMWSSASAAWPKPSSTGFPFSGITGEAYMGPPGTATEYTDDDDDHHQGVTFTPMSGTGLYPPHTGLSSSTPQVDALYIASRTVLSLQGTSSDCSTWSGTADVTAIDSHVIGCHIPGPPTNPDVTAASDCMPTDWGFIDQVSTQYKPTAGSGTFKSVVLTTASPKCEDVVTALPAPTM